MRGTMWIIRHIIVMIRAFLVLMLALFLPHIYLWKNQQFPKIVFPERTTAFKLGIENITDRMVYGKNVKKSHLSIALITNNTGIDQEGKSTIEVLLAKKLPIKKIFLVQDSIERKIRTIKKNHIPMIILPRKQGHIAITKNHIADIDMVMIDMQDSGVHYYGMSSVLLDIMKTVSFHKKKCIILDRPNLLGWCMEGFCPSLPLRYGMTVGEIAQYYNKYILRRPANLEVIPMTNYNRCVESGLMLSGSLSPDLKSIDSCYGYSFLGLLAKVMPFDIGLGTDKAFQCILLPEKIKFSKQKWQELSLLLKDLGVESKMHRYYNLHKKHHYSGLRLHINDINHFSSFKTLLAVLTFFKNNGVSLQFSSTFDQALGSSALRSLLQGSIAYTDLATHMNDDLQAFFNKACSCFLYKPYPKMIPV